MIDWTAPGTVHTGTFNLTRGTADWYKPPLEEGASEVVVDNLYCPECGAPRSQHHWDCPRNAANLPAPPYNGLDPRWTTARTLESWHAGYQAALSDAARQPTQPANRPPLSVESSVRNDTKELGLENSLPQTSLRNKTDVIELASLRYFTEDGVRYWTLHTELERLDRHQLMALAEMVRAEQAKHK